MFFVHVCMHINAYVFIRLLFRHLLKKFSYTHQLDAMDCGSACLHVIAKCYGRKFSIQTLRQHSFITCEEVSMLGISNASETIGFRNTGVKINFEQLCDEIPLPCIAHCT